MRFSAFECFVMHECFHLPTFDSCSSQAAVLNLLGSESRPSLGGSESFQALQMFLSYFDQAAFGGDWSWFSVGVGRIRIRFGWPTS